MNVRVLLVDDQEIVAEAVKRMLSSQSDIHFHYCKDPTKAIQAAQDIQPTVILQDLVMPTMSGLELVAKFRENATTKDVPMIVLSSEEQPKIKAEAFALGANDYLVKLPDQVELIARIRYHSESFCRLLERNDAYEKLEESQQVLQAELKEAAAYVASLLPEPKDEPFQTRWCFIPSTMLGGDAFGYHWLDEDHFALYLLDVCGHGVGAALHSISVANTLRSQTLPDTDFYDPVNVLVSLNAAFQMDRHHNMFFTIWYGVFNAKTRNMVYATGGHPPAVLLTGSQTKLLKGDGCIIGGMPTIEVERKEITLEPKAMLYLFSDGIYEIIKQDGKFLQLNEFIVLLKKDGTIASVVSSVRAISGKEMFVDDVSLLQVVF